ncbi:MAG: MBL fold metallo-hydrolase [Scytonema sp. PMC 1070.18]|nr:MBL fold metallo-hydrolase [Scytonema sp. PMC 1070.18]
MTEPQVYLKQNVILEPLFNQWYAWSYLISPVTAAMYIAHSHLKIMQSFVSAPQVHITTLKNPKMLGGPFINYGTDKVEEIKNLMEKTLNEQAHMLELAEAIKTLNTMLLDEATGYSLEALYQKVPEILKGYVELVYDLNNHPAFRLIEGFLYKSLYYNKSSQSIALFAIETEEQRSFAFSTPRIKTEKNLLLNIPFSSPAIDDLFRMKRTSHSLSDIKEKLSINPDQEELFLSFFTEEKYQHHSQYTNDDVRIRYFGHACLLIESKDVSILCDPIISYQYDSEISRYTYSDLPEKIDYVLITHNHQDHCLFETLLQLRHKVENIVVPKSNGGSLVDPSLKLILQQIGFKKVIELDEIENIDITDGTIIGLPFLGEHADLNIRTKIAYLLKIKGKSIVIAADSNNIENQIYQHLYTYFGRIDVLFLGMECEGAPLSWLYGPLLTKQLPRKMDQSRRFDGSNSEKAINMVHQLNPQQVYVYAMGLEPWLTYITSIQYDEKSSPIVESNKLITECKNHGIEAERLFGQKEIFWK